MELTKIKLAGFKSFVDPTTVTFPTQRCAIVGPNGCGKSNIIDAIRWVMGESSAKYLRGESMADVIFNGSSARKPVAQASVEICFDNSDGSLGGAYSQYSEIALRREVTRDGSSTYYLNGTRCRRRDIQDVFLGTGMGPRSYSVIEQGMISRIIEAKPAEMRVYIEEAAGISKYKERRRETENRMRHTRENLERLTDIREELERQLSHLQRQAGAAERYHTYKAEERTLKAQLTSLRWQSIETNLKVKREKYQQDQISLEAKIAELRKIEKDSEIFETQYQESLEALNQVQAEYYEVGSRITQHEQAFNFQQESKTSAEQQLSEVKATIVSAQMNQSSDKQRLEDLLTQREEIEPKFEETKQQASTAEESLEAAEEDMMNWQIAWDDFQTQSAKASETAEVEKTRIHHLEKQIQQAHDAIKKINAEKDSIDTSAYQTALTENRAKLESKQEEARELQSTFNSLREQISKTRNNIDERNKELNPLLSQLQQTQGRLSSLETLQQEELGLQETSVNEWLTQYDIQNNTRLAQQLTIEAGWEKALETVLAGYLDAICVDNTNALVKSIQEWPEHSISFVDRQSTSFNESHSNHSLQTLASKLQDQNNIPGLLGGIYIADDLTQALDTVSQLQSYESIITQQGIWLGPGWLKVVKAKNQRETVFQREQTIKSLQEQSRSYESQIETIEREIETSKETLQRLDDEREEKQREMNQFNQKVSNIQGEIRIQKDRIDQAEHRLLTLKRNLEEHNITINASTRDLDSSRSGWQAAVEVVQSQADKRDSMQSQRDELQGALQQARQFMKDASERFHDVNLSSQTIETEVKGLQEAEQRLTIQLSELTERQAQLHSKIEASVEPMAELKQLLEMELEARVEVDSRLTVAKQQLTEHEFQKREAEKQRQSIQHFVDKFKDDTQQLQVTIEQMKVRQITFQEQAEEEEFSIPETLQTLPEDADEKEMDKELASVQNKISRLGAINLAAKDEYDTQSERKIYLDEQDADLREALDQLEKAIDKIDQETKQRFKETFDQINESFKSIFPKVFGGGQASLIMTENDLLNTGVSLIARPPGKKNATIHLLSGGEKALTAISLVFAIFQLNPSPFCMLDEVDAPLDDANVGRFCNLLEEMSQTVKFIFISHNKLTIARAETLLGVTMNEPGVSRLVSVNVEEAVAMADA